MTHSFNTEIAKRLGIKEAILIENIAFWIKKNIANRKNFHNNKCYTYNSIKAFSELFEYMSDREIRYSLDKLKENQIIESENFNKNKYDRTKHYTITDKEICKIYDIDYSICIDIDENEYEKEKNSLPETVNWSCQQDKMEVTKLSNGNVQSVKPIPDNNTYNKPCEVTRAPLSEPEKSTYENLNGEYNDFERYIVSHYVELTGKPIMDIRQIPEFKTEQGRQVLRTAFDNRKNDWGRAIDNALNSTSKSNREYRWLDFMKSLYLNLASVSETTSTPKTEKQLKREKLYEALKNRFGELWEERYNKAWKPSGATVDHEFSDFFWEVYRAVGL